MAALGARAMIGTTFSHYRITAKLGEGGMGEVYLATDPKLGREVAIKVLPAALIDSADSLARFEREAKVLAQLHHPHIASIFGIEECGGARALILELVEGPTLAERIASGALPLDEALSIARQIAEALEAAHERGIVHRDLKPQNVKAPVDGAVKVLDFGLAKAIDPGTGGTATELDASPTLTLGATVHGMVLGTAAYMAPEQAKGLAVDRRADIWAFGVVLWEMLTGRRLFEGDSVPDVLANVLKQEVDLDALPKGTPTSIRRLLRRCLERSPRNRLHDVADARLVLDDLAAGIDDDRKDRSAPATGRRRERLAWGLAALLLGGFVLVLVLLQGTQRREPGRVLRATLSLPADLTVELEGSSLGTPVLSPDGTRVAFGAREGAGPLSIWVLELASGESRRLEGTEGGTRPFWSPDGREIAFFTWYSLAKIPAEGGGVTRLAPARDARGGSWSSNGTILFAPGAVGPLHSVASTGGPAQPVSQAGEGVTHRYPHFLPDGEHYLYLDRPGDYAAAGGAYVALGRLGSEEPRRLIERATNAVYASGHLLYVRDGALMAQPFDVDRLELTGDARSLVDDLVYILRFTVGVFSASQQGDLVFFTGRSADLSQLVWRDREGAALGTLGESGILSGVGSPELSPDGAWAAMPESDPVAGDSDLRLYDLTRGTETRLARGNGDEHALFSSDSKSLYIGVVGRGQGQSALVRRDLATGAEESVQDVQDAWSIPVSTTPDDETLLLQRLDRRDLRSDLLLWREEEGARDLLAESFGEGFGQISSDGRWLAWASDESGRHEIFVTEFPGLGSSARVTREGGTQPRWGPDGKELFFLDLENWLTVVPIETGAGTLSVGAPRRLFQIVEYWIWPYAVAPDGQRFLVRERLAESESSPLTIITGWTRMLDDR